MKKHGMMKLSLVRAVVRQLSQADTGLVAGGSVTYTDNCRHKTVTCYVGCKPP